MACRRCEPQRARTTTTTTKQKQQWIACTKSTAFAASSPRPQTNVCLALSPYEQNKKQQQQQHYEIPSHRYMNVCINHNLSHINFGWLVEWLLRVPPTSATLFIHHNRNVRILNAFLHVLTMQIDWDPFWWWPFLLTMTSKKLRRIGSV